MLPWKFGKWKKKKKKRSIFFLCLWIWYKETSRHKYSMRMERQSHLIFTDYWWLSNVKVSCNQVVPTSVWNHTWDSESEGGRNTGEKRSRGSAGRTDWCGWEDENEDRDEAEQKPEVLIERYIFVPNRDMNVLWEGRGEARRGGAAVQTQSDLTPAPISYSSESSDAGPQPTPLHVCLTLWVRASVKDFCVLALSVQTLQSHLFVSLMDRTNRGASLETLVGMKPH